MTITPMTTLHVSQQSKSLESKSEMGWLGHMLGGLATSDSKSGFQQSYTKRENHPRIKLIGILVFCATFKLLYSAFLKEKPKMQINTTPRRGMLRRFSTVNVFIYRISGGQFMSKRNGLPLLLLTTMGRSTSIQHTVPLVYLEDDESYVVMPGVYRRPDWYLNLRANPRAKARISRHQFEVFAEEVDGAERERLWEGVPQYWRDYQAQYTELLPLILLKHSS